MRADYSERMTRKPRGALGAGAGSEFHLYMHDEAILQRLLYLNPKRALAGSYFGGFGLPFTMIAHDKS